MKLPAKLGTTLLVIFLVSYGALPILHLSSPTTQAILHIIAIAAGVLVWLDR